MTQFESEKSGIEAAGAQAVFIAAEKRSGLMFDPEKYLVEHPVSFPFLLDEDRHVTKAYGVYHAIGWDAFNIAHPATFVVDTQRIVRFVHVGANQLDRSPFPEILNAVRTCRTGLQTGVGKRPKPDTP